VNAKTPNSKPLTPKQEAFVNHFIANHSAIEAFRACYKTSANEVANRNNAQKILKNPAVKAAIDAARVETHSAAIMTRAQALEKLTRIANQEPDGVIVTTRDNIAALDKLAKLEGWEKAQKLDLGGVVFNLNTTGAAAHD
jgi:phage terminase small subunit